MNPTTLLSGLGAAITADPSLGGATTSGRDSNPGGGGDLFLALVTGLLQGTGQVPVGALPVAGLDPTAVPADAEAPVEEEPTGLPLVATTGLPPAPTVADETPTESDPDETRPDPAEALSMLPIALALAPVVVRPAVSSATASAVPSTVTSTGEEGDAATGSSVDAATGSADAAVVAPSTGGSAQTSTDIGSDQPKDGEPATATPTAADSAAPRPTDAADQPAVAVPAGPRVEVRADAVPTQPTGVPAAVAVAPTTAPTSVAAPTTSADLPRVADQVFPEVLRATSSADNGTSRVTVRLNPESLGEVRVVLTQRRGELEVTLAGGADARRALTEGAPELRRLLEAVGRPDSRIFIRDLPTGTLPSSAAPVTAASGQAMRTDVSTDLAGGAWSGAGRPGGESAPDRDSSRHHPGSSTATDGIPGATIPARPIQTVGRTHAGLDLSM